MTNDGERRSTGQRVLVGCCLVPSVAGAPSASGMVDHSGLKEVEVAPSVSEGDRQRLCRQNHHRAQERKEMQLVSLVCL